MHWVVELLRLRLQFQQSTRYYLRSMNGTVVNILREWTPTPTSFPAETKVQGPGPPSLSVKLYFVNSFLSQIPPPLRLSLSSSRKGRRENKLNPAKEEFSPLLVSLTKNRRTVYIYNINAGTFYPPQTVQKMSGSELIRDFLLKERVCYSRLVKDLVRHF